MNRTQLFAFRSLPAPLFYDPAPPKLVIDSLVIPRFLEAEPTVTGNDKKGVFQAILYAQFEDNSLEIPVNIPGDDDLFGIWIFKKLNHFSFFRADLFLPRTRFPVLLASAFSVHRPLQEFRRL